MTGTIYSATYIAIFLAAFISMGFAIYNFVKMLSEVKPKKKMLSNFLAPIIFFIPGIFTEKGIKNKYKFIAFISVVAISVYLLVYLEGVYGKPPYMQQ